LVVVLLVLTVQFFWWAWPRTGHGAVIEESYRRVDRMDAHFAWMQHPSPATKAMADEEDRRLSDYIGKREIAFLIMVVVVDGVGLYYFCTHETRRSPA
jgi:hypothetical protein